MDWKTNSTLEPYPANSLTIVKEPRKRPINQEEGPNVAKGPNLAKSAGNTYGNTEPENQVIVKKVYVIPPEFARNDENIEFISPPKPPPINAANKIPVEDIVNYRLEDVNRGEIKPRQFLVSDKIITASAHLNVKDEFYQPVPKQGRFEGIYTFILLLMKMNENPKMVW